MMSAAMPDTSPALRAAQAFAERGWRPFPVDHPSLPICAAPHRRRACDGKRGKHPVGSWGTQTASTSTDGMLRLWFDGAARNIGIACGPSGLLVLDEDEADALTILAAELREELPKTYRVLTSRGWHWYFADPDNEFGNTPGALGDRGIDVRGGRGAGGYVVAAGSLHQSGAEYIAEDSAAEVAPLPEWIKKLIRSPSVDQGESSTERPEGDWTDEPRYGYAADLHRQYERHLTAVQALAVPIGHTPNGGLFRHALYLAALDGWRLVDCGLIDQMTMLHQVRDAIRAVWRAEPDDGDRNLVYDEARDKAAVSRWVAIDHPEAVQDPFGSASGTSVAGDAVMSWTPMDLTAHLDGTIKRAETAVGARRKDGLRFFYPGLEHAVIGETEGGKTWFLLASAAAELIAGNRVVYVHFEENDPGGTVSRLTRQFSVPRQRVADDFLFIGPEHPVPPGRIDELCAERVPALVVLDGQNEAMALHAQKIYDPDGAAEFRRRLVKPWTRHGASVACADHVVKDPNQNGSGYALGSVHKLNGLSGAGFLVENREAFGEGMKGNSGIYVVKDRPGQLRKAGKSTNVARKFHVAEMVIDDTGDVWSFCLHAPSTEDGVDAEFEQMREDRRRQQLDDEVFEVTAGLIGKGLDVSSSLVAANVKRKKATVFEALHRLVAAERIVNTSYGQAARYDLPEGAETA